MAMSNNNVVLSCIQILKILEKYYHFSTTNSIQEFLIPPSSSIPEHSGQILFEEDKENEEFFIGVQFGTKIMNEFENNETISINSLSVLSEEMSHFKLLLDTVLNNTSISMLELEMLGEIDRFLCLMHWNQESSLQKLALTWQNLHDICDAVFIGDRFFGENKKLYIDAEALAFKHLKLAFKDDWDATYYDFSKINGKAKNYLATMRKNLLRA